MPQCMLVVLYPFKWCVEDGDRQICVMPCSSSDHLSLSVRQKDYNDCYSSYPELHMCKRWNDTMILLLWLFWAHTLQCIGIYFFFCFIHSRPSSIHSNLLFLSLPSLIPLSTSFSFPPIIPSSIPASHLFAFLPPPFPLSPYSPSPPPHIFPPFSCFPYSTAVGGEIQVVETIMKWLTPRQDGAIDPLTPNALMSTLRPLLRLSKLKYRTLWGKPSLVPRPHPAFHRLQYGKAGRAWYLFSHEYDVISKLRKFAELTGCILRIFNRLHTQRSVCKTIASR